MSVARHRASLGMNVPAVPDGSASRRRVLITWPDYPMEDPTAGVRLTRAGIESRLAPKRGPRSEAELVSLATGCVAVIASTDPFSAEVLAALPELRLIARVGVGTDSIDLAAATRQGVLVTAARGTNESTVADHTLALILGALRRIIPNDRSVRSGAWVRTGHLIGTDLHGKTVGLVGFGVIGREVAKRLAGFDVTILAFDPAVSSDSAVEVVGFDELLERSDVVSIHVPLSASSEHLIGAAEFTRMKRGAVLVNTSRGGVVDEASLAAALKDGRLAAAALDVFADEPPGASPFFALCDRTILTPHIAGLTFESIAAMQRHASDAVLDYLAGRPPHGIVNPPARAAAAAGIAESSSDPRVKDSREVTS